MKNLLFLVAITFTMLFTACSKNDESKLTDEEKALAHQEEMYQAMKKDIVGHWKGAQQFDENGVANGKIFLMAVGVKNIYLIPMELLQIYIHSDCLIKVHILF